MRQDTRSTSTGGASFASVWALMTMTESDRRAKRIKGSDYGDPVAIRKQKVKGSSVDVPDGLPCGICDQPIEDGQLVYRDSQQCVHATCRVMEGAE